MLWSSFSVFVESSPNSRNFGFVKAFLFEEELVMENSRFPFLKKKQGSSFDYQKLDSESSRSMNGDFSFGDSNDRRYAFSRQSSFQQASAGAESHTPISVFPDDSTKPFLTRTVSSIDIPPNLYSYEKIDLVSEESRGLDNNLSIFSFISLLYRSVRLGNKQMKKLSMLISLNVAYSTAELVIGIFSGRVGLVSDAFHLTFGCGILTFSLFAMATSRKKSDRCYTYGYKRLEVLSAFTNAVSIGIEFRFTIFGAFQSDTCKGIYELHLCY